ncbi:actin-related protein 5 isoform X1 [Beta vulgaris subsp. vulgaris]|uniref:actin-related protein 5 isoform X1 n=2 Tax=Beta vulgaris subsp. vulgaris TaxID=3555 RepID=UPI002036759C|nr:actin-related protein 5 isoform X1 [Beta vulgaris subsp. vulgaris]
MPFISQIERQTDYRLFPSTSPIVIDNGGSYFRIGWAGESDPRVIFRNIVQRPRHKSTGETVSVVGDHNTALLRYFDCTRSGPRSAFDNNVVYQFDIMEYILDFGFDRLGVNGTEVDHPVLITECPCNPLPSRCRMAELLFESYGVPSVAFGVDAAFSYTYNQRLGICDKDGLAICSGFNTSHVIPFVEGEPVFEACCRSNIGGYHVTDYMKQLLSLKYPQHLAKLTWEKVEDLKMEHCYIAQDYASEVKLFQNETKEAQEKTRCWQLPFTPPPPEEKPSEEEIARKAAIKERQGQRLRDMAEAKRASRINELENELRGLDFLLRQLEKVDENDVPAFLSDTGYVSKQEIEAAVAKVNQSLRKAKREQVELGEKADAATAEKFPLVDIPDNMLTQEQLKEKKKQIFLKTTAEGRQRARQKRAEEELEREKQNQLEEEKRLENPELYLGQLQTKYKELSEKVEQKKRLKTNGNNTNGNNTSGGVGRGERMSTAKKERMRLLTTAAFDRGKGEDTFGAKDEDWQLYKLMSKDNDDDDEGPDLDEAELTRVSARLQEIDPTFTAKVDTGAYQAADVPRARPLTKEDFQILMGVERFRCPEILFNPNLVGIDQSGLDEMVGISLRRFSPKGQGLEEKMTSSIFLTGGSCQYPGLSERLEAGVRMIRPCGTPIKVIRANDPVFDAWRGASSYAASLHFPEQIVSKYDYEEKGEDWLRRYKFRYTI